MMYLKLSIRNARRSFTNYLLYVVTMTVLLVIIEISNCISIIGKSAGFQTFSLPLLITIIQIILVEFINAFMLKQRSNEFASYLLLGMEKKKLINLFLFEILLIGLFCFITGTTIGFTLYGFIYFRMALNEVKLYGLLYCKSMLYTLCCFCIIEIICAFRLKLRLDKLQIRELMYEKNRNQGVKNKDNYRKWGFVFISSYGCLIGFVCGIIFLSKDNIIYLIAVVAIPLIISVFGFYKWILGYLYAHRRMKSVNIYQKNRLYIMAAITSNFKIDAIMNAVFCLCFLFSASSFLTGALMLQPEFLLFEKAKQQWLGTTQISICIVFAIIYFSILALQLLIELRRHSKDNHILCCMGKNSKQIELLLKQQIAVRLTLPMIMALLIFIFCIPLLNMKMNLILPTAMQNAFFKFTGEFLLCVLFFYVCYFGMIYTIGKQYIKSSV